MTKDAPPDNRENTQQTTLNGDIKTEVVNQTHTDRYTVDIGRDNSGGKKKHMNNTEVGESGWLGNPYPAGRHGRQECIELFREDFKERLESDPEFRRAVLALEGEILGCYCKPKPCHGDVIQEFIETGDVRGDE
jgi:hypothetical protein